MQRFFTRPTTCSLLNSTGRNFALGRVASRLTKSLAIYYGWHSDETLYMSPWLFYFHEPCFGSWKRATVYSRVSRGKEDPFRELTRSQYPFCSHGPRIRRVSIEKFARSRTCAWKKIEGPGELKGLRLLKCKLSGPASPRSQSSKSIRRNSANGQC